MAACSSWSWRPSTSRWGSARPGSYSEALSRLDALYFTVTTLATVGFGDITPERAALTRTVTTALIVLGVALLGAGVRILIGVASQVNEDRRRRASPPT